MKVGVSIGEFSRLVHLSSKTLRYYHEIGLLVPDVVEDGTGHRRYDARQVGDAQVIRRLRQVDMPLAEIRVVVGEKDGELRDAAIARHLERMEGELVRTRDVVASLRRLLRQEPRVPVSYRRTPATPVIACAQQVARDEISSWCGVTFSHLYATLSRLGIEPAGAGGATYAPEFFERDEGCVTAFVPVAHELENGSVLAPGRFAVAVHTGPFSDFDLTYGFLGGHVAQHDTALRQPVREIYLIGPDHTDDADLFQTEICWPIETGAAR